ncbi:MAG: tRNA preQ1(34) S-adenosylmethionine ribosyltransferase-isomerase QueA [Proteobacteria bacterium]|nr:tRNA preQ1(34) S-adenosylmethionine ribosyltransferase-isomerase QueA [Pseudomonadota bacterium]
MKHFSTISHNSQLYLYYFTPIDMKLEDFNYNLPEELIAQQPSVARDHSRMMIVDRKSGAIEDRFFYDIPEFFRKGDCLVINNSRVIPARLIGKKETGGAVEILLLSRRGHEATLSHMWEVLLRPAKRISAGTGIFFDEGCRAEVIERISDKKWLLRFETEIEFDSFLEKHGRAPLPPYIKREKGGERSLYDIKRYQTVYARVPGSVAAPTAGLHFSPSVLSTLKEKGVDIAYVTLHVGYGTFLPIETESVEDHVMEEEFFEIGEEAAGIINRAKRVIAVGTTSTRVLESIADVRGMIKQSSGHTGLFIYPGYRFKSVDVLLTNFLSLIHISEPTRLS